MIINIQIHPFSVALTTGAPVLCSGRSPIFARMITVAAFVVLVVAGGVASGQGQSGRSITVSELNQEIDLSGDVHHVTFDASEPGVIFRFTGATPGQVVSFLFRSGNITLDEAAFSVTASPFAQVASPGITNLFDSSLRGISATKLPNGQVFLPGRVSFRTPKIVIFDPASVTWTQVASPPAGFFSTQGTRTVLLNDGRVFQAFSGGGLSKALLYTPGTDTWTVTPTLPRIGNEATGKGFGHMFLSPSGDRVLHLGGRAFVTHGIPRAFAQTLVYEVASETWRFIDPLPSPWERNNSADSVQLSDGRVVFVGNRSSLVTGGLVFDPATETYSVTSPPHVRRSAPGLALLQDGRVLVIGGADVDNSLAPVAECEIYDPTSDTWSLTGNLGSPAENVLGCAVSLADGRVWCLPSDSVLAWIYDPDNGTWEYAGVAEFARRALGAGQRLDVLLDGGSILRIGGEGNDACQVYDPSIGVETTSLPANSLIVARFEGEETGWVEFTRVIGNAVSSEGDETTALLVAIPSEVVIGAGAEILIGGSQGAASTDCSFADGSVSLQDVLIFDPADPGPPWNVVAAFFSGERPSGERLVDAFEVGTCQVAGDDFTVYEVEVDFSPH